ncbi:MAG: Maf family nucleotide pyrophosphatase [Chitinophagales bacterium]|nr:Maf family nucleotide pyrophosphatase [Chitinophagales bacterium]MDW8427708.1 Maf family nucleotide pyrophosphatase [Chitinophagales bacterium]
MQLVLASASPRRRQLLEAVGLKFRVVVPEVKEHYPGHLAAAEVAPFLSHKKALSLVGQLAADELLVAADTCVILQEQVLGKPQGEQEAIAMLQALSGTEHFVVTGVTLMHKEKMHTFSETTAVKFRPLPLELIRHYVQTYRPFDKAGAYGIQEFIGYIGVQGIRGCFYNVMGLPVGRLLEELTDWGYPWQQFCNKHLI